jgi:predicted RNA-binding Zn-ribbon protein involved in translation (DUF1610 family)
MKVTVEDIERSEEELEELQSFYISSFRKQHLRNKYGAFTCMTCGQVAVKRVLYDVSDSEQKASRVERYCEKCYKQMQKEEQTTLLMATNGKDKTIAVRDDNNLSGVEHK